jgi:hypothetical protein
MTLDNGITRIRIRELIPDQEKKSVSNTYPYEEQAWHMTS